MGTKKGHFEIKSLGLPLFILFLIGWAAGFGLFYFEVLGFLGSGFWGFGVKWLRGLFLLDGARLFTCNKKSCPSDSVQSPLYLSLINFEIELRRAVVLARWDFGPLGFSHAGVLDTEICLPRCPCATGSGWYGYGTLGRSFF